MSRLAALAAILSISSGLASAAQTVRIDVHSNAEVTSPAHEVYIPYSNHSANIELTWCDVPITNTNLTSRFNNALSAYGITATVSSYGTIASTVRLTCSQDLVSELDIEVVGRSGSSIIHWVREEDVKSSNKNWIQTRTYVGPGSAAYVNDITYYNGLGLPEMTVSGSSSGSGHGIVIPVVYDQCLRADAIEMLPFESADNTLKMVVGNSQSQRYTSLYGAEDAQRPYKKTTYDSFSLNRPTSISQPGIVGRDTSSVVSISYRTSVALDKVLRLQYEPSDGSFRVPTGTARYAVGLMCKSVIDENGRKTEVFSDALGREVLVRRDGRTGTTAVNLDTYTVYDDSGKIVYVVTPEGSTQLGSGSSILPTSEFASLYCTFYRYDGLGRMIERTQPGRAVEYFVYDKGDRMVLYQDGSLRGNSNRWIYSVYDNQGRIVERTVVRPTSTSRTVAQIRTSMASKQMSYPNLGGVTDYRIPLSSFTFISSLDQVRYGGQNYRSTPASTATAEFSIPSDLSFSPVSGVVTSADVSSDTKQMKVFERLWILGDTSVIGAGNSYIERSYHYDTMGRVVQIVERDPWGRICRTSMKYDFAGNQLVCVESRYIQSGSSTAPALIVKTTNRTYDSRGRVLSEETQMSGLGAGISPVTSSATFTYDALGRPESTASGDGITRSLSYTAQGMMSGLQASRSTGTSVFTQSLTYLNDGNISKVTSKQGSTDARVFNVAYDNSGRITAWTPESGNARAEKGITYDRNGNIKTLKRYNASGALAQNYTYSYTGDRLDQVTHGTSTTYSYTYDVDGRMTSDGRKGITQIAYNVIGYPTEVLIGSGEDQATVHYLYLSDGTKLATISGGIGYVYLGSMVMSLSASGQSSASQNEELAAVTAASFESTSTSVGRLVKKDGRIVPNYHINDYLGNVRVVTDGSGTILERNDYYGFGRRLSGGSTGDNRYRLAGKEDQTVGGVGWVDFGARMYDPYIARWTTMDPLAEKYGGVSPYAYCGNDPVNYVDPDGRRLFDANGKIITYDSERGWSSNADPRFVQVATLMQKYPTGSTIIESMLTSEVRYKVAFKDDYLPKEHQMGQNAVKYRGMKPLVKAIVSCDIEISTKAIEERKEHPELSYLEYTAGILAHEWGHGTVSNVQIEDNDLKETDANIPMNEFFDEIKERKIPRLRWNPQEVAHTY